MDCVNRSLSDLSTLNVLMSALPVVSITNWASTSPATPACWSMSGYGGLGLLDSGAACFSTWKSKYGWSPTGPVPPAFPLELPPSTPLPVKSASSVTFLVRSTVGMTSGMLTGALSTWKPFGGGGATIWSLGGGGGFGGSGTFFTSANWIFSTFSFLFLIAAFAVA